MNDDLRDTALRKMPAPVTIVGVAHDGVLGGLTAAWVTRVSLEPALLMVAVGHQRHSYGLLQGAETFTISLPTEEQVETARLFGLKSRRDVDKWAQVDHDLLGDGVPALRDCAARFLCRKVDSFRAGDHDCFVGEVLGAETPVADPALPMRGTDYIPRD
ncbi:hypothetical protein CSA17_02760 [bacterium DOLJORAL78_65_58]|nr:MAG: hypothetical protein CSB20_09990 [bacterium DOLZORAL124_64_63]PIE76337.1 MAG: hypothetical protein CSA17_02760 [bacterium DOLJORAL78_65_58]